MNTVTMHTAILCQPWQARVRPLGLLLHAAWLLALLIGVVLVAGLFRAGPAVQLALAGLAALGWLWCQQVAGLLAQNQPRLARLLPGQLLALRTSLLVQALVIGGAAFGLLSLLAGAGLKWLWLVAIALLLLAWLVRQPLLWIALCLLPLAPTVLTQWNVNGLPAHLAALPWAVQAALMAALLWALGALLGGGGAWHRRSFERQQRWRVAPHPGGRQAPVGTGWRRLLLPLTWPQHLHRRWLLRHATPANALARLDLGLQAGGLWPSLLWGALLMALVFGFALVLAIEVSGEAAAGRRFDGAWLGVAVGLFSLLCSPLWGRVGTLQSRQREQAVLLLLPGVPTGAELAAALEARWRREHLGLWMVGLCVMLVFGHLAGGGLSPFAAAYAAACLPLVWWAQLAHRGHRLGAVRGHWVLMLLGAGTGAVIAQALQLPPLFSLALGAGAYLLCAVSNRAPGRALLPFGR